MVDGPVGHYLFGPAYGVLEAGMDKTGRTLIGAEPVVQYGIGDDGDHQPPAHPDLHGVHPIPRFARILR